MYARLTTVYVKLDKIDEAIKIYKEDVIPAAEAQHGCRGCYLLTDRKTGKGIAFTMWETKHDANVSEQSGYYQAQISRFKGMFVAKPVNEGYDVSVQP